MTNATLDALKQIVDYAKPSTLQRLREAGAVHPLGIVALARTMPWLLGRGPTLGIVSRMNAIVLGGKPAVRDRHGELSFKELEERSNRLAHAFSSMGLRGGDRVATLLRNGREIVEVALAAQKTGMVASPLNTWARPKELAATLEGTRASVLVYDTAHAGQARAAAAEQMTLLGVGDADDSLRGSLAYEDILEQHPTSPVFPVVWDRGSPKIVIHTSGTTGTPKGAQRSSSTVGMGALANLLAIVPYRRDDVVFCPAPLFHSFGLVTFTVATALGATLVLPDKFDPEQSLSLMEEHGATTASFVPVMIRRIVSLPDGIRSRYDLSSLRIVLASGSAMSEDLRAAAMRTFGKVLYDLYGSTEVGWVSIATPDDISAHPKSVGKPVPGIDLAIFSDDGRKLPSGEIGEVFVKSDITFEGYTSGETKKVRDGYMTIGDLGRLDEDGYLYIEGRADDMVVVGGENIYPIEIEGVIEDVEGVEEVAVLGIPDEEYGEVLAAFVVGDADPDRIIEACRAQLASYKVPRRVEVVDDLPRTSTGKVLKRELLEAAADRTKAPYRSE